MGGSVNARVRARIPLWFVALSLVFFIASCSGVSAFVYWNTHQLPPEAGMPHPR
jgi:hypothetical protein